MVSIQYAPFGIADGNVHLGQNFPDALFIVHNDSLVQGYRPVLFKRGIVANPVRGHIGITVSILLNFARNGGSLEIVDELHLYVPDTLGSTVLLGQRRLCRLLSAMTRTEVLRWLPHPHFNGKSFCSSVVSVEKKLSSISRPSWRRYRPSRLPITSRSLCTISHTGW